MYISRAFWDTFTYGQFLWLGDMTSYVAGGQAIFGWKYMFFFSISFNNKSKSCKVFSYVLFFMKSTNNTACRRRGFKKIKGFQKSFQNTATYQKLWGEVPSITRFPLLKCTTVGGMNLCVRPRVDMYFLKSRIYYRGSMYRTLWWTHHRKYCVRNGFMILNTALDS